MSAPVFPVAARRARRARAAREDARRGDAFARRRRDGDASPKLNHPGGVFAYRIEHGGRSVVYATDTEHYACVDPRAASRSRRAPTCSIYDAQYTPEEYAARSALKVGWGHSTYVAGAELARAAGVGKLVLFHHDPPRTDDEVARDRASARGTLFADVVAAREGMEITRARATRGA